MNLNDVAAPWHRESYDRFVEQGLPELLAARLPLLRYRVERPAAETARVHLTVGADGQESEAVYDLPAPDGDGVFHLDGRPRVVVPRADGADLEQATVRCVGEQLLDLVEQRLSQAPEGLPWDADLLRAWLPLDEWVGEHLRHSPGGELDQRNALARIGHLRRLLVDAPRRELAAVSPTQVGRTCPFETPEGDNVGRYLHLAVGARIENGKLLPAPGDPYAALGVTASTVPFLEYDDPNRALMGVNMMRQWLVPPDPEPPLVRTGFELDEPEFWCGRSLLTAYLSLGLETFEDSIVVSESAAARLAYPEPLEPGDKLSTRHGTKGTVSRIRPDAEMPHLADGQAVDLVCCFIGCHTRQNHGQLLEAVASRVAVAEQRPYLAPPYRPGSRQALRDRLRAVGLPESGMERLRAGRDGEPFERPTTVGWVYWGKTHHLAGEKIHYSPGTGRPQIEGVLEYQALRHVPALGLLAEYAHLTAVDDDGQALAEQMAAGGVTVPPPPSERLRRLVERLAAAGIQTRFADDQLHLSLAAPSGEVLALAEPVPHPWLAGHRLNAVGVVHEGREYEAVAEADQRLRRLLAEGSPDSLLAPARAALAAQVARLCDGLVRPRDLEPFGRVVFTGRAVASVGRGLAPDQVGLPEAVAWALFGPLAARGVGWPAVRERTAAAGAALDQAMAERWVLIHRAPAMHALTQFGFRPVRQPDQVIRLHPLACYGLNADFDGDMVAVVLPLSEAGQRDVAERLSLVGHLRRTPDSMRSFLPPQEALLGLALLCRGDEGQAEVEALLRGPVAVAGGLLTRAALHEALLRLREREGAAAAVECSGRLTDLGFAVVGRSGASINAFIGEGLDLPEPPEALDPEAWARHLETVAELLGSRDDYDDERHGIQLLTVKCGARGGLEALVRTLHTPGMLNAAGLPRRAGRPITGGVSAEEMAARVVIARTALAAVNRDMADAVRAVSAGALPTGFTVLARARRSSRPGEVFARAAARGEIDPLVDVDSRLFAGLSVG